VPATRTSGGDENEEGAHDQVAPQRRWAPGDAAPPLRHGKRFPGKASWGATHECYLARIGFDHPAQRITFAEYRAAVMEAHERVERLTAALREELERWRFGPVVKALMCFKGIDFVAAAAIVSELGDMHRGRASRTCRGCASGSSARTPRASSSTWWRDPGLDQGPVNREVLVGACCLIWRSGCPSGTRESGEK